MPSDPVAFVLADPNWPQYTCSVCQKTFYAEPVDVSSPVRTIYIPGKFPYHFCLNEGA